MPTFRTLTTWALPSLLIWSFLLPNVSALESELLEETKAVGEGVEVKCSVPSRVAAGYPLPLRVAVTNISTSDIRYYNSKGLYGVAIAVFDQRGDAVPLTRWGRRHLESDGDFFRFVTLTLSAGETFELAENIARDFDLSIPGDYVVTVSWYSSLSRSFESGRSVLKKLHYVENKIKFRVVEGEQLEDERAGTEVNGEELP